MKKYLEDKIKEITKDEAINLFAEEFDVELNYYNSSEIKYRNYENENYKIESEIYGEGGEGQGDSIWSVSRVLDKKTGEVFFIRFDGYYSSWEGSDFSNNDWSIVRPQEVKVIQWV